MPQDPLIPDARLSLRDRLEALTLEQAERETGIATRPWRKCAGAVKLENVGAKGRPRVRRGICRGRRGASHRTSRARCSQVAIGRGLTVVGSSHMLCDAMPRLRHLVQRALRAASPSIGQLAEQLGYSTSAFAAGDWEIARYPRRWQDGWRNCSAAKPAPSSG